MQDNLPSRFAVFNVAKGKPGVVARFEEDNVWLTQAHLALLFHTTKSNIVQHLNNIFESGELDENASVKKFLIHAEKLGKPAALHILHYNLDVIIALGYKIDSPIAIRFRQWATERLHEYIQKGFALDDERLKHGDNRYFHELLQRIRDIRSSERNFYQKVTDIYATAVDYDVKSETTRKFFATVQNKLHYAVHEHTAAEIVHERVDNEKPNVGMLSFKGDYVTIEDVRIAKNYLSEPEITRLNLLVSQFLNFAEMMALDRTPMTMNDWVAALDNQIVQSRRKLLAGTGTISHEQAIAKAEEEFRIYRERELRQLESDFDRAMRAYLLEAK